MGAYSPSILGNDTSCEVYERFISFYDFGEEPDKIAGIVLEEQAENMLYDRTNVWIGLALACWECKTLTNEILAEVKNIVDTKEDIKYNEELEADSVFLKKRQKVLEDFIVKISQERIKARLKKKIPIAVASPYAAGMCLSYKNPQGKYIGIFLVESEHYRNKGSIEFWFLDFESESFPTLDTFRMGRLFGLEKLGKEWGERKYGGNKVSISYEKADKEFFFHNTAVVFHVVGQLSAPNCDRMANNHRWSAVDLSNPLAIVEVLESNRLDGVLKHQVSELTLVQLLDEIGETR